MTVIICSVIFLSHVDGRYYTKTYGRKLDEAHTPVIGYGRSVFNECRDGDQGSMEDVQSTGDQPHVIHRPYAPVVTSGQTQTTCKMEHGPEM